MDVPVSTLRAELKSWIERVAQGETVVITERGVPVAQLTPVGAAGLIADLEREGLIAPPIQPRRQRAADDDRPRPSGGGPSGDSSSGDSASGDGASSGHLPAETAAVHVSTPERRRTPDAPLAGIIRRRRR